MQKYWKEYPPVHILVRAFMQYEGPGENKAGNQRDALVALAGRMQGAKVVKADGRQHNSGNR